MNSSGLPTGVEGIVSGGVGEQYATTYGLTLTCMRRDFTALGSRVSLCSELWPVKGWPPEVDGYEDGGNPTSTSATNHYGADNEQAQHTLSGVDLTTWHVWGIEWSPGLVVVTCDGTTYGEFTANVPSVPMRHDIEALSIDRQPPVAVSAASDVAIDWTVRFDYAGAA